MKDCDVWRGTALDRLLKVIQVFYVTIDDLAALSHYQLLPCVDYRKPDYCRS
jgi:hypothetical protein